ncbi:MAG: cupin domain-containing protein [Planctomycetes bacterium]|nr:cupin domain-containing protein [Planctomycetota bacterium]
MHDLIDRLQLQPHPEGGWYRETHRSQTMLSHAALPDGYGGDRCAVTSILFLLPAGVRSHAHRVRSEEIFIHQGGDPMRLVMSSTSKDVFDAPDRRSISVGMTADAVPQAAVPGSWWQAAEVVPGPHGYTLVACVVAPGFDFADFEMVEK